MAYHDIVLPRLVESIQIATMSKTLWAEIGVQVKVECQGSEIQKPAPDYDCLSVCVVKTEQGRRGMVSCRKMSGTGSHLVVKREGTSRWQAYTSRALIFLSAPSSLPSLGSPISQPVELTLAPLARM